MIPILRELNVEHSGEPLKRRQMKISERNLSRVIPMLRDEFYSNKELAPIREYATNARDAHIRKGIPSTPIHVTLPSELDPVFRVRDFGMGLSEHELDTVYFEYCESTKRNTNDENGVWGIGAKSAFAYAESFVLTTWCEGFKSIMVCTIDGNVDTIFKQPTTEPEGVEVAIPIQGKDVDTFINLALNLFKYWEIRPVFHNIDEETLKTHFATMNTEPFLKGDGWEIRPAGYGEGEAVALMGFVPYPVDWNTIKNKMNYATRTNISGIFDFLEGNITTLRFPNGSLQFTPNREALQYKDETLDAITNKLEEIYNTLLNLITSKIAEAKTLWEAKIIYNRIFRRDLDGFDKSVLFSGSLSSVEHLLHKRIQWNGIQIDNGLFQRLELWDKFDGKLNAYEADIKPVLQTFVLDKDDGVKLCKCNATKNHKMICSPKSVVVIQDTDKNRLARGAARLLFSKDTNKEISQIYVLDLSKQSVRDEFFKHYHFDTVPVVLVSSIRTEIEAYLKGVRSSGGGNGGGNSGPRPLLCSFFTIKNRKDKSGYDISPNWESETVNAREIEGGVYVSYLRKEIALANKKELGHITDNTSKQFLQSIYNLLTFTGNQADLTKVHGLANRTIESTWFEEALEDGNWKTLDEVLKDEIENNLDAETMRQCSVWLDTSKRWGSIFCEKLLPLLNNQNGVAAEYCKFVAKVAQYQGFTSLIDHLDLKGDWKATDKDSSDFKKQAKEVRSTYPMVAHHDKETGIEMCEKNDYYSLKPAEVQEIADYINMVDSLAVAK
jgi:hypothetical protein